MTVTTASTGWTRFGRQDIRHSRGRSDKGGGRERGGRSRHDNMGEITPTFSKRILDRGCQRKNNTSFDEVQEARR
jgi:hypothetical protein